ncbi:MAG: hypothetical protein SFV51_18040 [Bryobacteraceae bacterium]|nr:hypothetical protein [Bryobacteraceae bacterium]
MRIEALVCFANEVAVETPLAPAGFVSRHQEDRSAARVEDECDSPFATRRAEPQFLHVGVT